MTKDDFIKIINENLENDEKAVIILEAFDDYVNENSPDEYERKLTEMTAARDDILRRYRERFTAGEPGTDETGGSQKEEEKEEIDVIDVRELS
jgi:hypothetical protein